MRTLLLLCQFTFISCVGLVVAQSSNSEVFVQSWRTGDERIVEQEVEVKLSSKNPEFSREFIGSEGNKYRLDIVFLPVKNSALSETGKSTESWAVELTQIEADSQHCENSKANLLQASSGGSGGDYFPREDLVGYLYPKTTSKITSNGIPMIDGKFYYPILSKRKIRVMGFNVLIKVLDYELNAKDVGKVDFLKVRIELKNDI